MTCTKSNTWVVVPFYNEAKGIYATIKALANQTDKDFTLLFVNNSSTDDTVRVVRDACKLLELQFKIVDEPQKGTGAAADTGFRYAIAHGAVYVARTDADCLPTRNWVELVKRGFSQGLEFMGGRLKLRNDDIRLKLSDRVMIPIMLWVGIGYGKLFYRGKEFKYSFFMAAGNNMAILADLYVRAGGFKRSSIAELNEDSELAEVVRTLTKRAKYRREMIVYNSIRRVRKYGYWNTLMWYSDRKYRGEVDIR
jgi:glycosyltransferase involved in cell wall biosynthesis